MTEKLILGPVLAFRGQKDSHWHTSALIVVENETHIPRLLVVSPDDTTQPCDGTVLKSFGKKVVWRFNWRIKQVDEPQEIRYTLEDFPTESYKYAVPAIGGKLRIAYGSCFGFHSLKDMKKISSKGKMFKVLEAEHHKKNYHIFFMGGDQVYADLIWDSIPELSDWFDKETSERNDASFTDRMRTQVEEYYFELYCKRWSAKNVADICAQIPTLMMWDDHDIFDGWGSFSTEQQKSPVMKGIYQQARDHFLIFQQQAKDQSDLVPESLLPEKGCTYAYRVDDIAIIALDMRSERTQDEVMTLDTWNAVQTWMCGEKATGEKSHTVKCKHVLLFCSIPVVYVNMNMLEDVLNWIPGQQELEDDLKDQWSSRPHKEERRRLIHRMLNFSNDTQCRTTIISGDVHVAAHGYIEGRKKTNYSEANVINQLISSAMVNVPPPAFLTYMLDKLLGDKVDEVERGIIARIMKFPETSKRFIGARNFLSLSLDDESRIWAEWFVEGEKHPFTKVIHPVK